MATSVDSIRDLREKTGCGVIDCKKALEEASGNMDKAVEILRQKGFEKAAKKSGREASEGRVETYIHHGAKIGVLVEVNCETDFVAKNEDFCQFAKDLAMHIAFHNPTHYSRDEVNEAELAEDVKLEEYVKQYCLLEQPFVKDGGKTIQTLLNELVAKIGENIKVGRFVRFKIGS